MAHEMEDFQLLTQRRQMTETRLAMLRQRAILTDEEEAEQLRLERRLVDLEPWLTQAQANVAQLQNVQVVGEVQTAWVPTIEEKRAAYMAVVRAIAELAEAIRVLMQVHQKQDSLVHRLPRSIWERLSFPDVSSFLQNFVSRLPQAWGAALAAIAPLTRGELNQVLDVDQGLKELPPRALDRFLTEHRG